MCKEERSQAGNSDTSHIPVRSRTKMGAESKKDKDTPDENPSQVFWDSLVKQKIPQELLGHPRQRASLKLRITKRYKIIAGASSLVVFAILAYIFGFILKVF